jgi:hypothetical protein
MNVQVKKKKAQPKKVFKTEKHLLKLTRRAADFVRKEVGVRFSSNVIDMGKDIIGIGNKDKADETGAVNYMKRIFATAAYATMHRDRKTIMPKDIELLKDIKKTVCD